MIRPNLVGLTPLYVSRNDSRYRQWVLPSVPGPFTSSSNPPSKWSVAWRDRVRMLLANNTIRPDGFANVRGFKTNQSSANSDFEPFTLEVGTNLSFGVLISGPSSDFAGVYSDPSSDGVIYQYDMCVNMLAVLGTAGFWRYNILPVVATGSFRTLTSPDGPQNVAPATQYVLEGDFCVLPTLHDDNGVAVARGEFISKRVHSADPTWLAFGWRIGDLVHTNSAVTSVQIRDLFATIRVNHWHKSLRVYDPDV